MSLSLRLFTAALTATASLQFAACSSHSDDEDTGDGSGGDSSDNPQNGTGGDSSSGGMGGAEIGSGGASPECCACLCGDESWSCSRETCLDPEGHAMALIPEAGFFELAGGSYVSEGVQRNSPQHRIWYSFQPAEEAPEEKPLAVFFNGGPGASTTVLFAFNTGPVTLDPTRTGEGKTIANPDSWTRFANLLYIDAPATGFSYSMRYPEFDRPTVGIDLDRDAASVLRVTLRFLARHPQIEANPVLLVGESYGGTRATLMLQHLFEYKELVNTEALYQDVALHEEIIGYFERVFPNSTATLSPAQIATLFGHQVLIQPVVGAQAQWDLDGSDDSFCTSNYDSYQCDEEEGWYDDRVALVAETLLELEVLEEALGVDPTGIEWLYAKNRQGAYGRVGPPIFDPEMVDAFGVLGAGDHYYLTRNLDVGEGYDLNSKWWTDPSLGSQFLDNTRLVNTFITNARQDLLVWMPDLVPALATYTDQVAATRHLQTQEEGVLRPGWLEIDFLGDEPTTQAIRFPLYEEGGHALTMKASSELLADVQTWYEQSL